MASLAGYTYRKKCTVVATTAGAQTNYQLELIVGESSGAAGEDVDCESLCQDFPNDIRFTKEDGETKHDYWIEKTEGTTPNRKATVIIEVASVPASGSVDFYMYYGKTSDSGESNGTNTFLCFDDASPYNQEVHQVEKTVNAPAITKLDNGYLLLVYYHGNNKWIKVYRSTNNGDSWSLLSTPYVNSNSHPDIVSEGSNDVWVVCRDGSNVHTKKSSDGGATWASAVNVRASSGIYDTTILYVNSNLLLVAIADNTPSPKELEIYKSVNSGTSWTFVTNAKTGTVKYEDICLITAPNGDIVLTYEKEWVEAGHSGVYCVRSTDNGATWGSEITILDNGTADNEGGTILVDGSNMYQFVPTDEDKGSGSYKDNNIKRLTSTDNGATWGSKTLIMDTKSTVEPCIIKTDNNKVLFFGVRQYSGASQYIYQVEIDMVAPKLFGTIWSQDSGVIYSMLDGTDKVLAVEGSVAAAQRAFIVNSLNIADFVIEFSAKNIGTIFDTRMVFRYTDTDNHYLANHSPTAVNVYKRVAGAYTALHSVAVPGSINTWYDYKTQVLGTNIKTWVDDVAKIDGNDSTYTTGKTGLSCTELADRIPCYFKDYRVQKYVTPEPTWGTWGNQQCLLQGAVSTTSSVSGTCSVSWKLSGTTSSISTLSGALSCTKKIGGSVSSTASVAGSLTKYIAFAGAISALSAPRRHIMRRRGCLFYRQVRLFEVIPATLSMSWSLKGTITATSTISGTLSMAWSLKGDVSAASSAQAVASMYWSLKGAIAATSSVSGSIIEHTYLTGSLSATSTISGSLSMARSLKGDVSTTSALQGMFSFYASIKGFYYAKIGSTIFRSLNKDSFHITEELNKIPSFEFEISNSADNRAAITAGITDIFRIYHRSGSTDTLMFTGIINGDAIEYLSMERIRIIGYASYIDLNWRFHQHLNSEDAENVGNCYVTDNSVYIDRTSQANNDTINDVRIPFTIVNDAIYIGHDETFFGMQVKYSTKGVQAANTTVIWEYSEGSSVWSTLDVLDETRQFTEDVGTYYVTIPHKPSDWAKETVNSVKKFWIRARLTAGSYTTKPKLDRIKIMNVDVYRVYYFETAANSIMNDVLAGTGYSMDVTDVCPSDTISIVAEYETKLRFIAGVANALTWDDGGDKKSYQWWIDTSKKVHFKQKRGATLGDITSELTILNNVQDYFNLSNRIILGGNYDGLNKLRAVIEDIASQDEHGIREHIVSMEQYNNYIPLKEAAQKAMTYTKAPLQKISATVSTRYWVKNSFEVGDTVTLHQDRWNVAETAFQIVRADIGPRVTNIDMGISQEHLDGLKAGFQRQLDISGIRMHGSTSLLQFGPETMNYQRVDDSTVFYSKLKFEIPSDARYIHKILISWKLGNYRADVSGGSESAGHDHTGYTGSSSAHDHTGVTGLDGAHTPTELSKAHEHTVTGSISWTEDGKWGRLATTGNYTEYENNHVHPNPNTGSEFSHTHTNPYTGYNSAHIHSVGSTGGPSSTTSVFNDVTWGTGCAIGACVQELHFTSVASSGHDHSNPNTGAGGGHDHSVGNTGPGSSHKHKITSVTPGVKRFFMTDVHIGLVASTNEDPAHIHTINPVVDHTNPITSQVGENLTVPTEPAGDVDLTLGIVEVAGGTVMQLTVNGEEVTTIDGNGTDVVITGYCNTGSNTVELSPIVGSNTKGGATLEGRGIIFIESSKF